LPVTLGGIGVAFGSFMTIGGTTAAAVAAVAAGTATAATMTSAALGTGLFAAVTAVGLGSMAVAVEGIKTVINDPLVRKDPHSRFNFFKPAQTGEHVAAKVRTILSEKKEPDEGKHDEPTKPGPGQ
jgi:hypothetical protein